MNAKLKIFIILVLVLCALYLSSTPTVLGRPLTAPPSNDLFSNAKALTGATGKSNNSNTGATKESWEPKHAGQPAGASIWFTWIAPSGGKVTFDTTGSNFDTLLAVYTWPATDKSLVEITSNDDAPGNSVSTSLVTFSATKNTKYYIVVDGYNGASGQVVLNWKSQSAGPANDNLSNATPIKNTSGTKKTSNNGATKESREPDHAGIRGGSSIWFAWTAPANGTATFDTAGSGFDTLLAVYLRTANDPPLTFIAANDDAAGNSKRTSEVTFSAKKGVKYYIVVDGYNGATGQVVLKWKITSTGGSDSSSKPPDIAEQFETSGSPLTATCVTGRLEPGTQWYVQGTLKKPAFLDLCFKNFDSSAPINLVLLGSDNTKLSLQLPSYSLQPTYGGMFSWKYVIPLDYPSGQYEISATQGNLTASVIFTMVEPTEPRIEIDPDIRLQSNFNVYLAGFPPDTQVPIYFFNQVTCPPPSGGLTTSNRACYHLYSQFTIMTDSNGQATHSFMFDQDNEVNNYVIKAQASNQVVSTSVFSVKNWVTIIIP